MGFAQFMVSSIKSNSRRQQRVQFDKEDILNSYTKNKTKPVFKKATPKQLNNIRTKLKNSHRIHQQKLVVYTLMLFIAFILIINYILSLLNL